MTKEEDISRNLTLIEYYKQQLQSIDLQLQYLQTTLAEYQRAKITLEHLQSAEDNTEMLIPVGAGAFVNGSLQKSSSVLLGVGAGVVMERTVDDAVTKLDERMKTIQENLEKMLSLGQKIQADAEQLSQKTQQMMEERQN